MGTPDIIRYRKATDRAQRVFAALGVMTEQVERRRKLSDRVEQFLWKFVRMRANDIDRFFPSIAVTDAQTLATETFVPGKVFHFFSERQNEQEFEEALTVGITLLFVSMNQAQKRGFDPDTAGTFTLERMLEQVVGPVETLEGLLQLGAPS